MTAPDAAAVQPAYLNLGQPDVLAEPRVKLHQSAGREPIAIVYLGEGTSPNMHIPGAVQARALAAAFTQAAELLDPGGAAAPGEDAGRLAEIRAVLAGFDWESDDRRVLAAVAAARLQYALEAIDRIAGTS